MSGSPHDFAADAFHAGQLYRSCFRELTETAAYANEMFVLLFCTATRPSRTPQLSLHRRGTFPSRW